MTVPTVHLNGTSREGLLRPVEEAGAKLADAIRALHEAAPNGRDYYPQGPHAYTAAAAEHQGRVERLTGVLKELEELFEAIASA